MKTIWCIIRDIIVILLAFLAVYVITHQGEVTKISVNAYIDSHGGITDVMLDQYFKTHNLEPDENENNN